MQRTQRLMELQQRLVSIGETAEGGPAVTTAGEGEFAARVEDADDDDE